MGCVAFLGRVGLCCGRGMGRFAAGVVIGTCCGKVSHCVRNRVLPVFGYSAYSDESVKKADCHMRFRQGKIDDPEKLVQSTHFWTEISSQLMKKKYGEDVSSTDISSNENVLKFEAVSSVERTLLHAPLFEELSLRGVVQRGLLRSLPRFLFRNLVPSLEQTIDSRKMRYGRIGLASAGFSACHLMNKGIITPDELMNFQLVNSLFLGIVFGALCESRLKLAGAIGAHLGANFYVFLMTSYPGQQNCEAVKWAISSWRTPEFSQAAQDYVATFANRS